MQVRCYAIDDIADIETLTAHLRQSFDGLRETSEKMTVEVYDSFDWRLHHKGWQLLRWDHRLEIVEGATGRVIGDIQADLKNPAPFSWDFPPSDFSKLLESALGVRALMPKAIIKKQLTRIDVCNPDDKIVARLEIESLEVENGARPVIHCRLAPVKGYHKASRTVAEIMTDLSLVPADVSPLVTLLEQSGASPGAYSSKIAVALQPNVPAAEAIRRILENLVAVMHMNIPGVRQDIDSEFLHDLRVSVRRARSLLSQMKGSLNVATSADLQQRLKAIGAATGNVRDLDVYLLKKAAYIEMVPDFLKTGILQLFRSLQRKRRYAKNRMVKEMAGADFTAALSALDAFVQSDPLADPSAASEAPGTGLPIGEVAKAAIHKRYRRVIKKGRRISDVTPDEQFHDLRIECKKLRYLLEFFASLFPEDQLNALIKQLKQLQENLGDYNDLSVQQDFLIHHLQTIGPQTAQVVNLAAATGGLITRLFSEQRRIRSQFLSVFEAFNSPENRQRFKSLFG